MKQSMDFNNALNIVNQSIQKIHFNNKPASLFAPIHYVLSLGGKKIRPALVLMSYSLYKDDYAQTIPAAMGVEIFHNFTLLHDDLMDKADIRRGQPSVHIKWNENAAILSGDAMLIEAYKQIGSINPNYLSKCLEVFSKFATEICCGQQLDMEFETSLDISIDEYLEMIKLKTAVLLGGALELGAILADAPEKDRRLLYDFGTNIGMAFQLRDDILDVYGTHETFGKRIGGDILSNKKTFLLLTALKDERERDTLISWINKKEFDENQKIAEVTAIYNRTQAKEKAENVLNDFYEKALNILNEVDLPSERKSNLLKFAKLLKHREV